MLSALLVIATAAAVVAQEDAFAAHPLVDKHIPHNAIPYQVDTEPNSRGPQSGYNICNSTTLGQNALCQTAYINSVDDWCLWAPADPNSIVADIEGQMVAWCTKPTHGTRLIPAGAITGVTFVKTPGYVQITGNIDQTLINMAAGDSGGEMDSGGADGRGNPIGSLVYSNQWANQVDGFTQANHWHNFMGGNQFCFKACDPAGPNAADLCQHIYDRIGCQYNAPADYKVGVFESCVGDNQTPPGIFTGANGQVSTYTQPPESLGAITSIPYTVTAPPSSQCTPFESASLFNAIASVSGTDNSASLAPPSASSSSSAGASSAPVSSAAVSPGVSSGVKTTPTPAPVPGGARPAGGASSASHASSKSASTGAAAPSLRLPLTFIGGLVGAGALFALL